MKLSFVITRSSHSLEVIIEKKMLEKRVLVFIYIYRIDINIERLISCWNNITFKQQYAFKFYKYTFKQKQAQATKQYVAIFKLFFVDAINGTFLYLFLLASLE